MLNQISQNANVLINYLYTIRPKSNLNRKVGNLQVSGRSSTVRNNYNKSTQKNKKQYSDVSLPHNLLGKITALFSTTGNDLIIINNSKWHIKSVTLSYSPHLIQGQVKITKHVNLDPNKKSITKLPYGKRVDERKMRRVNTFYANVVGATGYLY